MPILDGKKIAEDLKKDLHKQADELKRKYGHPIKLATVIIGDDPGSKIYATAQEKLCAQLNIEHIREDLPGDIILKDIKKYFDELIAQGATGIIVNQPVSETLHHGEIIERLVKPRYDVECLHPENFAEFYSGYKGFAPCTSAAVMELLKRTSTDLSGKEIVIIGYSKIIGKPLSLMLDEVATITTCHIGTTKENLKAHINRADVLITAVGKAGFQIEGEWIKKNAVVIDVATRRTDKGIVGDVDFETAKEKASFITPVPGGVGPVTNVMLIKNLLYLYKNLYKQT